MYGHRLSDQPLSVLACNMWSLYMTHLATKVIQPDGSVRGSYEMPFRPISSLHSVGQLPGRFTVKVLFLICALCRSSTRTSTTTALRLWPVFSLRRSRCAFFFSAAFLNTR